MEIFIIDTKSVEKVSEETLRAYQKKDISIEEKRKIHCLSYLLVDKFLKEYYGIENTQLAFEDGKPMLLDGCKYFAVEGLKIEGNKNEMSRFLLLELLCDIFET